MGQENIPSKRISLTTPVASWGSLDFGSIQTKHDGKLDHMTGMASGESDANYKLGSVEICCKGQENQHM